MGIIKSELKEFAKMETEKILVTEDTSPGYSELY